MYHWRVRISVYPQSVGVPIPFLILADVSNRFTLHKSQVQITKSFMFRSNLRIINAERLAYSRQRVKDEDVCRIVDIALLSSDSFEVVWIRFNSYIDLSSVSGTLLVMRVAEEYGGKRTRNQGDNAEIPKAGKNRL